MITRLLILFILINGLSGCMSLAWIGYKKPATEDFVDSTNNDICIKVGKRNLNYRQRKAITEAVSDVCKIFSSNEFKDSIKAKSWLSSCDLVSGSADNISGNEVYNTLMGGIPNYSIHARKPWRAIAQTQRNTINVAYNRVAIKPKRIAAWFSSDLHCRAKLINTIAHETTHIISNNFRDRGHGSNLCPNDTLVSYGVGNIAEKIWIEKNIGRD